MTPNIRKPINQPLSACCGVGFGVEIEPGTMKVKYVYCLECKTKYTKDLVIILKQVA